MTANIFWRCEANHHQQKQHRVQHDVVHEVNSLFLIDNTLPESSAIRTILYDLGGLIAPMAEAKGFLLSQGLENPKVICQILVESSNSISSNPTLAGYSSAKISEKFLFATSTACLISIWARLHKLTPHAAGRKAPWYIPLDRQCENCPVPWSSSSKHKPSASAIKIVDAIEHSRVLATQLIARRSIRWKRTRRPASTATSN